MLDVFQVLCNALKDNHSEQGTKTQKYFKPGSITSMVCILMWTRFALHKWVSHVIHASFTSSL